MLIRANVESLLQYQKVSFPVQYGRLHLVETDGYQFWFNLNGEPKYVLGKRGSLHPLEWLKRTQGNDWVYYSAGDYNQFYDTLGEFYLPCFPYPSNALWKPKVFSRQEVKNALRSLLKLPAQLTAMSSGRVDYKELALFISQRMSPASLWQRSLELFAINQARVQVLPPDARDVDYDVIPVHIADGCLYNCGFCLIKDRRTFQARSKEEVISQLQRLREFYGPDMINYSAIFVGGNDALAAGIELVEFAIEQAYRILAFERSLFAQKTVYLFASPDSFLGTSIAELKRLDTLPVRVMINIGLESFDQGTLDLLRKPVKSSQVVEAFNRLLLCNTMFPNIEVTANFVLGAELPAVHFQKLEDNLRGCAARPLSKGRIYLSPLSGVSRKEQLEIFRRLKLRSRLPLFLYLLQRI